MRDICQDSSSIPTTQEDNPKADHSRVQEPGIVVKGFTEKPGVDFHKTFSPVVKLATIRTVLTLAVQMNWPLHQIDVNNAFLQRKIQEDVYMSQPPGYEDANHPTYVCHLTKSNLRTPASS